MVLHKTVGALFALVFAALLAAPVMAAEGDAGSMDPAADEGTSMSDESPSMDAEGTTADAGTATGQMPIIGMPVMDSEDQPIGKISNVIISPAGRVEAVVLSTGGLLGLGSSQYEVPWDRIALNPDGSDVMVGVKKDDVETEFSAFEVKPAPPGAAVEGDGSEGEGSTME